MLPLAGAIAVAFAIPAQIVKYIRNPFLAHEITPILPSMPVAIAISAIKVARLTFAVVALLDIKGQFQKISHFAFTQSTWQ